MSSVETTQEANKYPKDTNSQLTEQERQLLGKLFANPLDFPTEFRSWLEGFILTILPTGAASNAIFSPGMFVMVPDDLSANSGAYVYEDANGGSWLYCNGAQVSQTTYADLYAAFGANAYGTDSGGNFYLPDTRGRALWCTGTNSNTNRNDNDGVAEASRQPKHTHTDSFAVSGTFASSSHTHTLGTSANWALGGSTGVTSFTTSGPSGTSSPSLTGSVGSGMSGSDAVAHIVLGSCVVKI